MPWVPLFFLVGGGKTKEGRLTGATVLSGCTLGAAVGCKCKLSVAIGCRLPIGELPWLFGGRSFTVGIAVVLGFVYGAGSACCAVSPSGAVCSVGAGLTGADLGVIGLERVSQ